MAACEEGVWQHAAGWAWQHAGEGGVGYVCLSTVLSLSPPSAAATSAALPSPSFISPPTTGLANPAIILIAVVSTFMLIGAGVVGLICFRCFVIWSQRALGGCVPYEAGLLTSGAVAGDMDVVLQNRSAPPPRWPPELPFFDHPRSLSLSLPPSLPPSLSLPPSPFFRIGQGRFAVVYRGLDNGMSVAVKVFEPVGKESFCWESDIYHMGMLGHPNVLQFIGENRSANGFRLITAYHEWWVRGKEMWREFVVVSPCKMSRKVHCQQIRMATSFAGIYQCSLDRGGAGSQWLCWLSVVVLGNQWLCW